MPRTAPSAPASCAAPKLATPMPTPQLALQGALWLQQGTQLLGGADRVALLEAIAATGSLTHAAKAVGLSYKTAWERVHDMNTVAGRPLVERVAGGKGGGGATLTPHAVDLIAAFRQLEQAHARLLGRLGQALGSSHGLPQSLSTLGLRTSARNQLCGTVTQLRTSATSALVTLRLPLGSHPQRAAADTLRVSLTAASVKELGLAKGRAAVALIKAPSIGLVAPDSALQGGPGNRLQARIEVIQHGAASTEVQLRLRGGQTMVSTLSTASAAGLELSPGAPVLALFDEHSVILGVS